MKNKLLKLNQCMVILAIIIPASAQIGHAQDSSLLKQLEQSKYLKKIMETDSTNMGITRWLNKKVFKTRTLPLAGDFFGLRIKGPGTVKIDKIISRSQEGSILLEAPSSPGSKNPSNRNYASAEIIRPLNRENLEDFNRFSVWVYADAPGFNNVFVGITLYNEGKQKTPTPGRFEGQHFVSVYPGKWQQIVWEMPDIYRDAVTGFSINMELDGSPKGASDIMRLYVDDMRIDQVEAENSRGFDLRKNSIAYCHSGYKLGARKQALVQNVSNTDFEIIDSKGETAFQGKGQHAQNGFIVFDFSSIETPGNYIIKAGKISSKLFPIGNDAFLATAWRTLNFFFTERCGYDQPRVHQICHQDVFCVHPDGRRIPVNGGWHDAGDLTQAVGNTARAGMAMLELAQSVKDKNKKLYERLLEEARWGLNWTMQTRFGDGYREGGLIIGIWTDNIIGTKDDIENKATNNPFDNFIAASYCASAESFYKNEDPVFARWCRNSAIEDFKFANDMLGMFVTEKNETELYAQAVVAAMHLFRLTSQKSYLVWATQYAQVVMDCQQKERRTDWTLPLHGFFYESREKKRILAFFHRSNEELMVQGLGMLLTDVPQHPDAVLWRASCQAYADYIHEISNTISPYGIMPAAVYELNNADFSGIYHEGEKVGMPSMEEYNAQVKNGIPLSAKFYLRRFPVAYQFRGFHAVLMGKAKAAFILADILKDNELRNIATRQLEYIVGYNPFAISTIYGDGYDYPPLYGGFAGDVVGAVPVGIETFENEDAPYMPMQINATYKEIWTHTTASAIWLLSKLFKE